MNPELRFQAQARRTISCAAVALVAALFLAACAPAGATSSPPESSSQTNTGVRLGNTSDANLSPEPPTVLCNDVSQPTCDEMVHAALLMLPAGRQPVEVEVSTGAFCPTPGLLFAGTTCPGGMLGNWAGSVLVSYAESAEQGYVNVSMTNSGFGATLIALASPPRPTP